MPEAGTSAGGGIISVSGDNFIDTPCVDNDPSLAPCLQCMYTALTGVTKKVPAKFVDEHLVTCVAPSSLEMGFEDGVPVQECGVGCFGRIRITVSSNGIEFTSPTSAGDYKYRAHIFFENFEPNAGPVQGNTTVIVSGRGFYPGRAVNCRFGNSVVRAKYISYQQMECLSPPLLTEPVDGGIFTGFSTNGVDFCELLPVIASEPNGALSCNFTNTNPVKFRPFFYHKAMSVSDISPPSGISSGGTEVHIKGQGFTNYGQSLHIYFGEGDYEVSVPATIINETHVRFTTPRLPEELNSQNQDTAGEGKYYILDKAYPMRVTSNAEQFTITQVGQDCLPASPPVGNPQAQCTTSAHSKALA